VIIRSIEVKGFRAIDEFKQDFSMVNCIVGYNACGKTTLLSLLAGICGTDEAQCLIEGERVDFCRVVVSHDSFRCTYSAEGVFDRESLLAFKKKLPHRVNFALTEWGRTFSSDCCSPATASVNFDTYVGQHDGREIGDFFRYSPRSGSVEMMSGDGHKQAMMLFLNDSINRVPVLYDNPGRYLDLVGKRLMMEMLIDERRQLFYSNHFPEMLPSGEHVIDMSQRALDERLVNT
jgi:hypothetical protein